MACSNHARQQQATGAHCWSAPRSLAPLCTRWAHQLAHNLSTFTDKQLLKMQEAPDAIPEGETPHAALMYAHEHDVDAVRPGDRVVVTGVPPYPAGQLNSASMDSM